MSERLRIMLLVKGEILNMHKTDRLLTTPPPTHEMGAGNSALVIER